MGRGLESLGSRAELGEAGGRSRSRSRSAAAVDVAIDKMSGLCGGSLVSSLASDDLALGHIVGDGFGHGPSVDGTAADVPVDESEEQNSHGVDAGVVHLL